MVYIRQDDKMGIMIEKIVEKTLTLDPSSDESDSG